MMAWHGNLARQNDIVLLMQRRQVLTLDGSKFSANRLRKCLIPKLIAVYSYSADALQNQASTRTRYGLCVTPHETARLFLLQKRLNGQSKKSTR